MSEDSELEAKIARLTGRIERHKTQTSASGFPLPQHSPYIPDADYRDPHRATRGYSQTHRGFHPYGFPPQAPAVGYSAARPGPVRTAAHRNRTLVLNGKVNGNTENSNLDGDLTDDATAVQHNGTRNGGWVTKHDRHKQLINHDVYEQRARQRTEAIEETQQKRQAARAERRGAKIMQHVQSSASSATATTQPSQTPVPEIRIEGIRFFVVNGGSKLIKASGDFHSPVALSWSDIDKQTEEINRAMRTPKTASVGGVKFHRSKHGNLYRSGLVKTRRDAAKHVTSTELCPQFTLTGTCPYGPVCRYTHDPTKVAMCRDYLTKGKCIHGDACDLSHDPTAARVPACLHFQRDACTKEDCRYAHVRINPAAPVCGAFARLGYCEKAEKCTDRHVHECPDYANKGQCNNGGCRLPHVDRAGQLRKAARRNSDHSGDDDAASDLSSDEEAVDSDDVDSDDMTEMIKANGDDKHELSQQVDFVNF